MKEECAQGTIEGVGFEVTFGRSSDEGEEDLAREEPIVISLGQVRRILLRGRIDRINRLQDGTYEVVDYKTGGFWRDDWAGVFASGTRLQHALYRLAATNCCARPGTRRRRSGAPPTGFRRRAGGGIVSSSRTCRCVSAPRPT